MVKLVRDEVNRIPLKVTATIDYTGFSATLRVSGANKSLANLKAANLNFEFTPDEVEEIGEGAEGFITVLNKSGDIHVTSRVWFAAVDTADEAAGFRKISVVLVSMLKYEGGRRPTSSSSSSTEAIQEAVDEAVAKAMEESIDKKVESAVDAIIDDKVGTSVAGIIDGKVETAVDSVIDKKVEETVNALFDSSESGTVGGAFTELQEKVIVDLEPRVTDVEEDIETNIEPRLSAAETTLEKKISMDFDVSDEDIHFKDGLSAMEESSSGEV